MRLAGGNPNKRACLIINRPKGPAEKTVVIYGVQRGGTSMVAAVVDALGVDLGAKGYNHEDPRFQKARDLELDALITERNRQSPVWGFKTPQAVMKLDYLIGRLRNPYYVCVIRNPVAVMDSILARGGNRHSPGFLMRRTLRAYDAIEGLVSNTTDPLILINYERAAADPRALVATMADFLEISPDDALRARAEACVTGDGGGYVRAARAGGERSALPRNS